MIELQESTKKNTGKILDGFSRMMAANQQESSETTAQKKLSSRILGNVYNLMVRIENEKETDYQRKLKTQTSIEQKEEERHQEVIRALSLKRFTVKKKNIEEKEPKTKVKKEPKTKKDKKETPAPETKPTAPSTPPATPATTPKTTTAPAQPATPAAPPAAPAPKPVTTPATTPPAATPPAATTVPPPAAAPARPLPVNPKPPTAVPRVPALLKPPAITGGLLAAAALSVRGETGAASLEKVGTDVKKIGQIVDNDPKPGVKSYGIFGINSQGSVQKFVVDNPQFNLTEQPGTKEFDDKWKKLASEKTKEFYDAQIKWYEKYVYNPLKADLKKILPAELAANEKVITYMADRRNQMGKVLEKQAIDYAKEAKTAEEFVNKIAEHDITDENIRKAFPTYIKTHGENNIKGLQNRVELRKKMSLEVNPSAGQTIDGASVENKDMKKELSEKQSVQNVVNNIQMSQSQSSSKYRGEPVNDIPAFLEKRYNG
jgi:hypothetical protein